MKKLLALSASAGTGKTYALALRYLALLFKHQNISDIVALTFTNKAAKEMQERVREFLFDLQPEHIDYLQKELAISKEEILKQAISLQRSFLRYDLQIVTIDSFVQKILRKFAYYAGLASDFEIEEFAVFEHFLENLSQEEFERFLRFARWYGKASLEEFFELLYEKDKELLNIKLPNSTDNTQKILELYHKIATYVQDNGTPAKQKEFCAKKSVEEIIYTKSGSIKAWLTKESFKNIRGVKYEEGIDENYFELKEEIAHYFRYKEALFLSNLFSFYKHYKEAKIAHLQNSNALSFTDIKHFAYKILQEEKLNSDFLYFRLDSKVAHLLIDEFQDTSIEDWKILEPLVDEIASGVGVREERSFFYVGDTKQAIYGFRGGRPELFGYVQRRYGMDIEELDTNYRSKEEIVEFVNENFSLSQKSAKEGGYVAVIESEDILKSLEEALEKLFSAAVALKDIAILVPTNSDILKVADFLEERFGIKAITSTSKKVIHQPRVKGLIDLLKYFYFNQEATLYLFNFFSLFETPPVIEPIVWEKPVMMIRKLLDHYDLWDESTLILLEESAKYKDIDEFLAHIEECERELKSFGDSIEVLTIHKSKGLSFEHTIVLDSLQEQREKTPKVLFDYEDIALDRLYFSQKGRELFDKEYREALERYKERSTKESKNLAYVALTRAKESLILIKKPKNGLFWFIEPTIRGELSIKEESLQTEEFSPFTLSLRYYGKQEVLEEEDEFEPNDYKAIYKGEAFHKSFEIGFEYVKSRYGLFEIDLEQIRGVVREAQTILEENFKGKIFKEIPFVFEKRVGIIDLLIEEDERFVVVDYKSVEPQDPLGYQKQVRFYKQSIQTIENKLVDGYLLYLDKLQLKRV